MFDWLPAPHLAGHNGHRYHDLRQQRADKGTEALLVASMSIDSPGKQPVLWLIAIALSAIALALWLKPGQTRLPAALAQAAPLAGARGVYAFTGQLDANRYGLFMLDIDQGTIWCYEFDNVGGARKLRLTAARTWIYDRYLKDFNSAPPDFRMVQQLVAQQRAQDVPASSPTNAPPQEPSVPTP